MVSSYKSLFLVISLLLILPIVSSLNVDIPVPINYSTIPTFNNSLYFDGYTPTTLWTYFSGLGNALWCELTGCTMAGDINMGGNNILDVGNLTADYFIGNGSLLTGIDGDNSSWNESYADVLYYDLGNSFGYYNSTTLPEFTNGTDGIDGINGINGTDGIDGINGINGTDGIDGINGTFVDKLNDTQFNNISDEWSLDLSWFTSYLDSVYATISSLANYLSLTGGTMTGDINMGGNNIVDVGNLTADYFIGNGSLLTGIDGDNSSWNESYADVLYYDLGNSFGYYNSTTLPEFTNGTDGIDGINGTDGIDGINGTDGIDGINGINGTDGIDGINGTDGIDGINGTDGYSPIYGIDYINGTDGIDGINGINGTDGIDGINGINGTDGIDGINGTDGYSPIYGIDYYQRN